MSWISKLLLCKLLRRHRWFYTVISGYGFNLKTGAPVSHHDEYEVCVRCRKKRPCQPSS